MLDILQLRINVSELQQLHYCQSEHRTDCRAAFTVPSPDVIWPLASWGELPPEERINVRSWFPLLDKIADEFLLWWPKGGCFFVSDEEVRYKRAEKDAGGVLFLHFEVNRPMAVASKATPRRVDRVPELIAQ
jgi:hypothetical protein